ncbi:MULTISPECIES: hypothetical protein [unclassified Curtobacterium]|uniref:hypothetical protein n=1 Tax=unclassified Curtobacterium TaxID=257496 RepID=UPI003826EC15
MSARANWDARAEDATQVAERVDRLLSSFDQLLGAGSSWTIVEDDSAVPTDADQLRSVVDEHVYRDAEGIAFPARGYLLSVAREGVAGFLAIRIRVGSTTTSKRMPANAVHVTIAGPKKDGARLSIDSDLAEGVLRGLVRAWEPDSAAVYDHDGAVAAEGRGKFAPVIGQRTWVSNRLGEVETATSGVRLQAGDGGQYIVADDALDSKSAVLEVWSTLQANGISEIARSAV